MQIEQVISNRCVSVITSVATIILSVTHACSEPVAIIKPPDTMLVIFYNIRECSSTLYVRLLLVQLICAEFCWNCAFDD